MPEELFSDHIHVHTDDHVAHRVTGKTWQGRDFIRVFPAVAGACLKVFDEDTNPTIIIGRSDLNAMRLAWLSDGYLTAKPTTRRKRTHVA